MTKIDIQKKGSPVWPWIIGIILAFVLVWILVDTDERKDTAIVDTEITEPGEDYTAESDEVQSFLNFAADGNMGIDHEYTSSGIQNMADALEYIADNSNADVQTQNKVDELNNKAESITQDPESTKHADKIKDAFVTAADLITNLQQSVYPELNQEAQDVVNASENINSNELTLNQKQEIKNFFDETAQVVRAMSMQIESTASMNNDRNM